MKRRRLMGSRQAGVRAHDGPFQHSPALAELDDRRLLGAANDIE